MDEPAALYWELISGDGDVVGVIGPDCLTLRLQRTIRAEKARVLRRLKRGLPSASTSAHLTHGVYECGPKRMSSASA